MLRIDRLSTDDAFRRLEPEWTGLLEQSEANEITLTYEWLSTWWEVFGADRELFLLTVRDGAELIGIAPLLRREIQHYGLLRYRRLEFLASGEDAADEICSDYLDFIVKRGREREAMEAIVEYLAANGGEWDELLLTDMHGESVALAELTRFSEHRGFKWQVTREQTAIYVPLPATWDEYLERISRNFRRRILQGRRIFAEQSGELRVIDSDDGFEEGFRSLIELHQARWTGKGDTGVFASEKFTRFHRLMAPKMMSRGWLRLFVMSTEGRAIAALYDFVYAKRMWYYQSGQAEEAGGIKSPGVVMHSFALEYAIRHGLTECDFLKGDPKGHKSHWQGEIRPIVQVRMAQAHSKEAVYGAATRVIDGLRQIRKSLQRTAAG